MSERNVLGEELATCSTDPRTGFDRDGCCGTHPNDRGRHELCAVITDEFLSFEGVIEDFSHPEPESLNTNFVSTATGSDISISENPHTVR
jgi:uncharacterized protein (DUF2237 family)